MSKVDEAAREVGKWLNEDPNRPINKEHVAMLVYYAQQGQGEAIYQAEFDRGWHDIAEADLWKYRAPNWPDCVIRTLYTAPQPLPTDDTALLFRALNALVYYREQTRPIEVTDRVIGALQKRLESARPLPDREPLTDEQERALCEGHCAAAEDEYFKARPQLDSAANRRIFYAGHRKAWIEWEAAHGIKKGGA